MQFVCLYCTGIFVLKVVSKIISRSKDDSVLLVISELLLK